MEVNIICKLIIFLFSICFLSFYFYMWTKKEGAQDHHYIKRVKRMVQDTKKMGCPTQKIVKEVMKFPQFQVTIFNLFVIILCTFESRKRFNWKGAWKGHFKNHAICRPLKKNYPCIVYQWDCRLIDLQHNVQVLLQLIQIFTFCPDNHWFTQMTENYIWKSTRTHVRAERLHWRMPFLH